MVEAMGVEPMSATLYNLSATCLAFDYTLLSPQKHRLIKKPVLWYKLCYKTKNPCREVLYWVIRVRSTKRRRLAYKIAWPITQQHKPLGVIPKGF